MKPPLTPLRCCSKCTPPLSSWNDLVPGRLSSCCVYVWGCWVLGRGCGEGSLSGSLSGVLIRF